MGAPKLTIQVEPDEASSVVYGPLAPKSANDPPNAQLSLALTITNNDPSITVHLTQVDISFSAPPIISPSSIAVDVTIGPLEVAQWAFEVGNNIILPIPAPATLELALYCDNFSDPATLDIPLAPYNSPVPGGGYAFPFKTDDLKTGEFWVGASAIHASGYGTQLFAYDLLVHVYDPSTKMWPTMIPGADVHDNKNYYAWGKQVYAMADGTVVKFLDGVAPNTPPDLPMPTPAIVEGNHFYIQHGEDIALYAHLQAGTLNSKLTAGPNADGTGAPVTMGDPLGLVGNSGNASEPHTHIHVLRATAPWAGPARPLPFSGIYVLDLNEVDPAIWPPNDAEPWAIVTAEDLPNVVSAIWPGELRNHQKYLEMGRTSDVGVDHRHRRPDDHAWRNFVHALRAIDKRHTRDRFDRTGRRGIFGAKHHCANLRIGQRQIAVTLPMRAFKAIRILPPANARVSPGAPARRCSHAQSRGRRKLR